MFYLFCCLKLTLTRNIQKLENKKWDREREKKTKKKRNKREDRNSKLSLKYFVKWLGLTVEFWQPNSCWMQIQIPHCITKKISHAMRKCVFQHMQPASVPSD